MFVQLLDLSRRSGLSAARQCSYAQSTLLLELTNECFLKYCSQNSSKTIPANVQDILEWLRLNYNTSLPVRELAEKFGYHPSYLTALFKRFTGQTITEYRNRQRIRAAENLLTITPYLPLAQVGALVGIEDEKYFMRLFKRYEGVTPAAYRIAFHEKRKNRI